ncbi:MAG: MmcQ/YjbR family DNA-binding protein [Ruminococcaceae bacterium]|nr:MmcQ/YjbR family DNA-binding protein [Oscillospiraceae bacterium]
MNREEFIRYTEETYSVTHDHPFSDDNCTAVFRHSQNRKWFALVMTIPQNKLGIDGDELVSVVNLKCDPDMKYSFIDGVGIFPAYHMSKRHWITAILDGRVEDDKLKWLLDVSYDLTGIKRKNAVK